MNISPSILITAFEPFGGDDTNASLEAMKALPEVLSCGVCLVKLVLPVVFGTCGTRLRETMEAVRPAGVIALGMAAGRDRITPEVFAVNARYAASPDNAGQAYLILTAISDVGPAAYRSTLPVEKMAADLREHGIPAGLSFSAGTYVCNDLFYALMGMADVPAGFVHVPQSTEAAKEGRPSMEQEKINRGVALLADGFGKYISM